MLLLKNISGWMRSGVIFLLVIIPALALPSSYCEYSSQIVEHKWQESSLVEFLTAYISQHPQCEPAFLKLAATACQQNRIESVSHFFRSLTTDAETAGFAQWALAKIFWEQNQPDSAMRSFSLALASNIQSFRFYEHFILFDKEYGNRFSALAKILNSNVPKEAQQFSKAMNFYANGAYADAASMLCTIDDPHNKAFVQFYLANCYIILANRKKAAKVAEKALAVAKQQCDLELQVMLYNLLFTAHWDQQQDEKSRKMIAAADSIARISGDKWLQNRISINQNFLLQIDQNYRMAEQGYKKAAENFKADRDYRRAARAYYQAAECAYTLSRYSQALDVALQSLSLFERVDDHFETIGVLKIISKIYASLNHYEMSRYFLDRAKLLAEQYDYKNQQLELEIAEQMLTAMTSPPQKALVIYDHLINNYADRFPFLNVGLCYWMSAKQYEHLEQWQKAEILYQKCYNTAKDRKSSYLTSWAIYSLAKLQKKQDAISSPAPLKEVIDAARGIADLRLEAASLLLLGDYFGDNGQPEQAVDCYHQSVRLNESLRDSLKAEEFRIGHMAYHLAGYQHLAEFYADRFKKENDASCIDSIFVYEEMHHARSLKDRMYQKTLHIADTLSIARTFRQSMEQLRAQQRQLRLQKDKEFDKQQIDQLRAELISSKYNFIAERINVAHLFHSDASAHYRPRPLATLQSRLKNHSVLLYHVGEQSSFVLAINQDSVDVIFLHHDSRSLVAAVDSLIAPMHNVSASNISQTPFFAAIAYRLYNQLFRPIVKQFPLENQVFIIPDTELAQLPFDILLSSPPKKAIYLPTDEPDYAESFLVHDFTFFYGPNTVEFFDNSAPPARPRTLILADPFEGDERTPTEFTLRFRTGWRFDPLPYAKLEAIKIRNSSPRTTLLVGKKASEQALKSRAKKYDFIHLATHAFVDTLFEDFSGLALALDDTTHDDGLFQGYEIQNDNFSNNLIVLSACETGRGKSVSGEGVLALPRQFLLAGVKSVLMSHWRVDDRFTSLLMPDFYHYHIRGKMSKAGALRQAKIAILENKENYSGKYYSHPFFWAAFNLYGDPGQAVPSSQPFHRRSGKYLFPGLLTLALFLYLCRRAIRKRT